MSQICPDCKKEFFDSSNYCDICGAKLPNAKNGTPDYKSGQIFSEAEMNKLKEYMLMKFKDPMFQEKLLKKILLRAGKGHNADSKCEKYFSSEIIEMFRLELLEDLESN